MKSQTAKIALEFMQTATIALASTPPRGKTLTHDQALDLREAWSALADCLIADYPCPVCEGDPVTADLICQYCGGRGFDLAAYDQDPVL